MAKKKALPSKKTVKGGTSNGRLSANDSLTLVRAAQ